MAIVLVLMLLPARQALAEAPSHPTRLIDNFIITDVKGLASKKITGYKSKGFVAEPNGGPVWVMTNYLAEEGDGDALGVTSFDIMPSNVKVRAGDNVVRFPAREMARFRIEDGLTLNISGKTIKLTDNVLRELMTPEQFADYLKAKEKAKGLLQLVQLQTFDVPANTDSDIMIDLTRLENMKAHSLEVVIGQGDVPPELLSYMEKQNGSWLYRNRHMLAMIATLLLMVGWFWRRVTG